MTEPAPGSNLGRHVFGVAALAFGLITLAWHDYNGRHLPRYSVYAIAAALIFGGAAIQFRQTAKTGAVVLGAVFGRLPNPSPCLPGGAPYGFQARLLRSRMDLRRCGFSRISSSLRKQHWVGTFSSALALLAEEISENPCCSGNRESLDVFAPIRMTVGIRKNQRNPHE